MNSKWFLFFFLLFGYYGCDTDNEMSISELYGLSLYWDHEVFGEDGRRLRFEFTGTEPFEHDHELVFGYSITNKKISVRLSKSIDKGKCQYFPMPAPGPIGEFPCTAHGGFYIPEEELKPGNYTLDLITPYFESTSELVVTDEKIILTIPSNDHFICSIREVYPIPQNILFGSVVFSGEANNRDAGDFLNDLLKSGLAEIRLPDYPYRHLNVNEAGEAIDSHWEPDSHSLGFIYSMDQSFIEILDIAKGYYNKTNLDIFLYSSNGDQGLLTQGQEITVVLAE